MEPEEGLPVEPYEEVIGRLVRARAAAEAERSRVHEWYARQCASAQEAVADAAAVVARTREGVASAQAAVDLTDREAKRLWDMVRSRLGPAEAARLGTVPEPAEGPVSERPGRLLEAARDLVYQVEPPRGRSPRPLLALVLVLLLLAGLAALWLFALR